MKGLSSTSKTSSGVDQLTTQKVLSWSSSLILIRISRILSLRKRIIRLMTMSLYWRKQLGNSISDFFLKYFVLYFSESLFMPGYFAGRRLNGIQVKA